MLSNCIVTYWTRIAQLKNAHKIVRTSNINRKQALLVTKKVTDKMTSTPQDFLKLLSRSRNQSSSGSSSQMSFLLPPGHASMSPSWEINERIRPKLGTSVQAGTSSSTPTAVLILDKALDITKEHHRSTHTGNSKPNQQPYQSKQH